LENCNYINDWNSKHKESSYWLGPNPRFIDRLPSELTALIRANVLPEGPEILSAFQPYHPQSQDEWTSIDWRYAENNPQSTIAVTEIKDQGDRTEF
jgi:hypothetical protein